MNELVTLAVIAGALYLGYRVYQKKKGACCAGCAGGAKTCGDAPTGETPPFVPQTQTNPFEPARPIGLSADLETGDELARAVRTTSFSGGCG